MLENAKILQENVMDQNQSIKISWQNQQNGMRTQRRLRSAWTFTQSDQSLLCKLNG